MMITELSPLVHARGGKVKFRALWYLAERMDWERRWPRWLWRRLLIFCDRANGYRGAPEKGDGD